MIDNLFLDNLSDDNIFDDVLSYEEVVEFFTLHSRSEVEKVSPVLPYKGKDGETGEEKIFRWVRFVLADGKKIAIHCGPTADELLDEPEGAKELSYGIVYEGEGEDKTVEKLFGFLPSSTEEDWADAI